MQNTKPTVWTVRASGALAMGCLHLLSLGCSPENIQISVESPTTVKKDERFVIQTSARNTATTPQTLVDIDVGEEYLEGIVIESTEPPFSEAMHIPIDNTMSYSFDLAIAPGEEVVVIFHAYAAQAGDHSSEVDFCINSETSCLYYPIRTIVQ